VNTGWSGGKYGVGKRMSIEVSRALVHAALNGDLDNVESVTEPAFGLQIPVSCPGVPTEVLNPRNAWADKESYDSHAADLAARFEANFHQFDAPEAVRAAGPMAK
jgi:phosphoenolpyruvate carboxykinase (ATP)